MSKNINVNPDHYKVAGRERQGEDIVHEDQRNTFQGARAHAQKADAKHPHIPNQEKASEAALGGADANQEKASEAAPRDADAAETPSGADEASQPLSDDEGMID
jgi:hypothetical protein